MNRHNEVWGVQPLNDRLQRFAVVRVSDPGRGKSQVCTQVRSRKDADLISACHEMYSALKALEEAARQVMSGEMAPSSIMIERMAAQDALAKAEVGAR